MLFRSPNLHLRPQIKYQLPLTLHVDVKLTEKSSATSITETTDSVRIAPTMRPVNNASKMVCQMQVLLIAFKDASQNFSKCQMVQLTILSQLKTGQRTISCQQREMKPLP